MKDMTPPGIQRNSIWLKIVYLDTDPYWTPVSPDPTLDPCQHVSDTGPLSTQIRHWALVSQDPTLDPSQPRSDIGRPPRFDTGPLSAQNRHWTPVSLDPTLVPCQPRIDTGPLSA